MREFYKFINSLLLTLPSSGTLSYGWNAGSMLGVGLGFQLLSGSLMFFFYESSFPFDSVQYIMHETNWGWLLRLLHANGASMFFIFLFAHLFKGLFYCSARLKKVWLSGVVMLMMFMLVSFTGYVLIWSQMSFWAAVVITTFLSVVPFFGESLVVWMWGGFTVSLSTLKFFLFLHFLLPWVLLFVVLLHLILLHDSGSTSSVYVCSDPDKMVFSPFYMWKDIINLLVLGLFFYVLFFYPFLAGDPEVFKEAEYLVSPPHIVPEWYFLFAYAILRSIPNKVLGVLALFMSLLVLMFLCLGAHSGPVCFKLNLFLVWIFIFNVLLLSYIGHCPVEPPYIFWGAVFSFMYFFMVFFMMFVWFCGNEHFC
uniref:Cytochrome b n=1 Tax=Rhigonema thysanophora TaxID=435730 RepID=X2CVA8_9BILA|nr:cytochrome b [Rhigonema thysanophora]AGZ90407.1 cytochrome b [Rhigonema thysanophora]